MTKREEPDEEEYNPYAKTISAVFRGVAALAIILIVLSSVRIVNAGEAGILLQFGEVKGVLHEGIHFVIPLISDVKYMSVQIEKYEASASSASSDLQVVSTNVAVNYQLYQDDENLINIYRNFRGDHAERMIQPAVQEAVKASTAQYTAEALITERPMVRQLIAENLRERLSRYGLDVKEVSITNFDFSEEFNDAIEMKVVAEQQKQQMQIDLEKKQIEVQKTVAEANATAESTILKAQAQAEAIDMVSSALERATSGKGYLQLQWIQKWDGNLPMVVSDGSNSMILMVPQEGEAEAPVEAQEVLNTTLVG
jgi:regulator of protease activity HflC (stomatin/prohibitin superfamily)